ncbi:MAG: hypothetical protein JSR80_03445 [Verrucomicrobia bacterium]|nr:hypothetical protein [Verrucomicrobiota bacterium]
MRMQWLIGLVLLASPLGACDKCKVPPWLVVSYDEEARALIDAIAKPLEEGKISATEVAEILAGTSQKEPEIVAALTRLQPYLSHREVQEIFASQAKVDQEWATMLAHLQN